MVSVDNQTEEKFTWEQFEYGCHAIVKQICASGEQFCAVYGIPKGGLFLAVRLANLLNIPLIVQQDPKNYSYKPVLICDDISDTGKTLLLYKKKGYKIATLHLCLNSKVKPDFYVYIKQDRWIEYPWERNDKFKIVSEGDNQKDNQTYRG